MKMDLNRSGSGIETVLKEMTERTQNLSAYLNGYFLNVYKQAQLDRFQSENESQGNQWAPLEPTYAAQKLKKYAGYPGGGQKTMIATGLLMESVTGQNRDGFNKVVDDRSITISINETRVPYAKYAAEKRPIMDFSKEAVEEWKQALKDYIQKREGRSWLRRNG